MSKTRKQIDEAHGKAWALLSELGMKLNEKMGVRSAFVDWSGYKDENPFISKKIRNGKVSYYHSEHDQIKNFMFETEKEVVLANAILLNTENFNPNEFREVLKFTFRLIGIKSEWAK